MIDKRFWAAAFTLSGTLIGAGILGLPYVFSKPGFLVGLFWIVVLGLILIYAKLCLGEVSLRTKSRHQLTGYAEKYLGKTGKGLMFFAMMFGIYSALIAYLIGEGQSFSQLFTGSLDYAIYFAFGFWLIMTLLLNEGLKGLKKIESYGVMIILGIILIMFFWFLPDVQYSNLTYINPGFFFIPFGVALFALLGFSSIPEIEMELKGYEKKMKSVIIVGSLIPIFVYLIFCFVFIGVLGNEITEVATLSFGRLVTILGIFTMLTSYFVLSFSLRDMFRLDIHSSKLFSFIVVSLIPLIIYLLISYYNFLGFIRVLGIGGVIAGGLTGILVMFMNKSAKLKGDRKPEYVMPINWFVILFLTVVFLSGIVVELFF